MVPSCFDLNIYTIVDIIKVGLGTFSKKGLTKFLTFCLKMVEIYNDKFCSFLINIFIVAVMNFNSFQYYFIFIVYKTQTEFYTL